jgi:hypothetical protein
MRSGRLGCPHHGPEVGPPTGQRAGSHHLTAERALSPRRLRQHVAGNEITLEHQGEHLRRLIDVSRWDAYA